MKSDLAEARALVAHLQGLQVSGEKLQESGEKLDWSVNDYCMAMKNENGIDFWGQAIFALDSGITSPFNVM